MPPTFNPQPEVPAEIEDAAQSGRLVVFVGAGISRLVGCPSWDGFANKVLEQLVPAGIDYYELSQINSVVDPKKRLSIAKIIAKRKKINIDYAKIFEVTLQPGNIYESLNSFNCSFVTTNYERLLVPTSRKAAPESEWRFYRRDQLLGANLDANGNVVHLHGCSNAPDSMIITTRDYLDHYSSREIPEFLHYLFENKTVLFLGYGLEEIEILEYILRRGGATATEPTIRRFILQGFFNAETSLHDHLNEYYKEAFATELIAFPKDYKNYAHQVELIAAWARKLQFGSMVLADEAASLEDEIRG